MNGKDAGFSLVEAIATLAVLSILMAVGLPSFKSLLQNQRAASARYQLTYTLASARMAAVTYREPVSVCPIDANQRCRTDGVWEYGWMTFRDPARNGQPQSVDAILNMTDRLDESMRLRSTQGRRLARFQPDGRSGGSTLTLSLCASEDRKPLGQVILNNAGRSRVVANPSEDETCARAG
ncbi:MAG: GspH/FimT family pseudopilin [Luteimonas sp.]